MKSNPSRTLFRTLFATGLLAAGLCSCCPKHNTLTQAEIADGSPNGMRRLWYR